MLRTIIGIPFIYVVGGLAITGVAIQRLFSQGEVDIALWIVLPIAWWVSFLPTATGLVAVFRLRSAFRTLETLGKRVRTNELCEETVEQQVDYWTDIAARETRVPRFMVRKFVARVLRELLEQQRGETMSVEQTEKSEKALSDQS